METRNKPEELTSVILKFTLAALAFLAGCFLNYLETLTV